MDFKNFLRILVKNDGSDLYLTFNAPPAAKFQGVLRALSKEKMSADDLNEIAHSLMSAEQQQQFDQKPEMNLALDEEGIGRFRINIFKQRNNIALVIRNIKVDIPNADSLGLPQILKDVIMEQRGLVLFVGGTGSGKSTSLAALIDHRNGNSTGHIITIEDPIEYIHPHKKCLVSQREVGVDTDSYEDALENTLRQAPDVILIGEVRTQETMEHAMAFAETGHLCLSTLHANNANQALDRIINFFPEERRHQLLMDLSLNLKAFISQRLIPTLDGKRVAAIEILLGTSIIQELIMKGDIHGIKEVMERSEDVGMQTFDSHLFKLYREGIISYDEMMRNADSPNNLKVKITLLENPITAAVLDVANSEEGAESVASPLDGLELAPMEDEEEDTLDDDEKELLAIKKEAEFQRMRKKALMERTV
ncbi:MAG: PilT/PilU family type 4a pilus ATPase [Cocleimonas sp.]|nr:PilT/PilU family type 4a pilus ATPase [Cocleimonas sp.]